MESTVVPATLPSSHQKEYAIHRQTSVGDSSSKSANPYSMTEQIYDEPVSTLPDQLPQLPSSRPSSPTSSTFGTPRRRPIAICMQRTQTIQSTVSLTSTTSSLLSTSSRVTFRTDTSATSLTSATSSRSIFLPPPYAAAPNSTPADAKAIITLDGGGVRGIFAVLFLKALQEHLPEGVDVRSLIDLVGGTSTGGIGALMFARLGMSLDECEEIYTKMPKDIFGKRKMKKMWWLFTSAQHSTQRQRKVYANVVTKRLGGDDIPLRDPDANEGDEENGPRCPVFVVSVETEDVSKPVVMSSYPQPPGSGSTTDSITILDAALATSAAPTYFLPTQHAGHTYIDGGVGFNNPAEVAVKQLGAVYGPTAYAHTVLSLGTGRKPCARYASPSRSRLGLRSGIANILGIMRAFAHISTDAEAVHLRMEERFEPTGAYFRFNPTGLEDVVLDDWTAVGKAVRRSKEYLAEPETQARIAEVAQRLLEAKGLTY